MILSRRDTLLVGAGAFAATLVPALPTLASKTDDAISALTGGADLGGGAIDLTAPEIAENGNTVPISFSVEGAESVTIYADGNPVPNVATFNFGPLSPNGSASTRVRLAKTQNIVAVAKMKDGSWQKASSEVKVTIGGCGG